MAARIVFDIPELLCMILEACEDEWTLLHSQRVSKAFKSAIDRSAEIQRKLCFSANLPASSGNLAGGSRINPLIAHRSFVPSTLFASQLETEPVRVLINSHFMAEPGQATGYTYTPRYPVGSWRRMYLVQSPPAASDTFSYWIEGASPRPYQHLRTDGMRLGEMLADARNQRVLAKMGLVECFYKVSSEIKSGVSSITSDKELYAHASTMILTSPLGLEASRKPGRLFGLRCLASFCLGDARCFFGPENRFREW